MNQRPDTAERAALTPRVVVEAALALADAEGLAAVTIRRLAKDLGVTPMALYWHFRNKDQLLDGMVERICEKIDLTADPSRPWAAQLRALLASMLGVLRSHPATAPLFSTHSTASEANLRMTEVLLDILRRGGFSPAEATQVARHALTTLTGLVGAVPGTTTPDDERARQLLESLPPEQYPRLVEAAGPLSVCEDPDGYFAFGLDLLLAGIEAMARRDR
ncbi:TetR/AcrR family transcriptional regulator [Prauserella oleivorans]|uniref:TetR/AcrR family transcriptional regulator n=1 Tax=Prauserella oleivorans TaxID=1478153 RepID=A0ABW5W9I3_9PSEU